MFSCFQYKPIFFEKTPRKIAKVSHLRGILQLVFYQSLPESPIMTSAGDIYIMPAPHCFFTSIRLDTKNVITTIVSFTLMYCKTEIRFENYGIEYVKFVIRRLKFVFSDFFSLQIKLLLCCRSKLKHWMPPQCLKKKFLMKQRNQEDYFRPYKSMKKKYEKSVLFFSSFNSVIPNNKFIF